MSIKRVYSSRMVDVSNTVFAENAKNWVQAILAINSVFTLDSVITDTSSVYRARICFADSPVCFDVYNSSDSMRVSVGIKTGSTYTEMIPYVRFSSGASYTVPSRRLLCSSFDDFLVTLGFFGMDNAKTMLELRLGKAHAEYLNSNVYFCYLGTTTGYDPTNRLLPVTDVVYPSTVYAFVESTQKAASFKFPADQTSAWGDIAPYTGNVNVMIPNGAYAYCSAAGSVAWTGHLKWGGRYDLFRLYTSGSYAAQVDPAATYQADGAVYPAAFSQFIIPVET